MANEIVCVWSHFFHNPKDSQDFSLDAYIYIFFIYIHTDQQKYSLNMSIINMHYLQKYIY